MSEKIEPWFVTEEMRPQIINPRLVIEAQRELSPIYNKRVKDLIRKIIPVDPHPTPTDRIKAGSVKGKVKIEFMYTHDDEQKNSHTIPGDELPVTIERPKYPREEEGIPESTLIRIGKERLFVVSEHKITDNGKPINRPTIEGFFKGLLDDLETDFDSGEVVPTIYGPRPIYGPYLDEE